MLYSNGYGLSPESEIEPTKSNFRDDSLFLIMIVLLSMVDCNTFLILNFLKDGVLEMVMLIVLQDIFYLKLEEWLIFTLKNLSR